MPLYLKNGNFDKCEIGISAHKDAEMYIDGLNVTNARRAIVLRDEPGLFQKLGLPDDTPPQYLIAALKILEAGSALPDEAPIEQLEGSDLFQWLREVNADVIGIGKALISEHVKGLVASAFEHLIR
jgi:hypothetical protein